MPGGGGQGTTRWGSREGVSEGVREQAQEWWEVRSVGKTWGGFMWDRLNSGRDGGHLASAWEAAMEARAQVRGAPGGGSGDMNLGGSWLCLEGRAGRTSLDIGEGVGLSLDDDWVSAGGREGSYPPGVPTRKPSPPS